AALRRTALPERRVDLAEGLPHVEATIDHGHAGELEQRRAAALEARRYTADAELRRVARRTIEFARRRILPERFLTPGQPHGARYRPMARLCDRAAGQQLGEVLLHLAVADLVAHDVGRGL